MAEHQLNATHGGCSMQAAVGDTLVVRLPENPTTGHQWQFALPAGLSVLADEMAAAGGTPGAAGERMLRLRADAPGRHALSAQLRRSWEAGAPPTAQFAVTVDVA
jgi:inhibitor of cysteine peptidase